MDAVLKKIRPIGKQDVLYEFYCPEIAGKAQPGQFVEVKVTPGLEPFLRRPFSVFSADRNFLKLLVRTVGEGTKLMTKWTPGDIIDIIGPLGRGYSWRKEGTDFILAAGGIGVAPLNFLAEKLLAANKNVHMLFSPKRQELLLDAMPIKDRIDIRFAANRGEVAGLLEDMLKVSYTVDGVFTCGPNGLMKAVVDAVSKYRIPVQVSMEEQMACGIGICLGCAVPIKTDSGFVYKKACHDGPVFNGEEVLFND
jgi:dihydroorotate dehydrogenase electron transfer subunit